MDSERRIRRMEDDGVLTPEQARMLRESLGPRATRPGAEAPRRRRWSAAWIGAGLAVVAVAAIVASAFTGGVEPGTVQDVAETMNQPGAHGAMNRTLSTILAAALLLLVPLLIWMWLHNRLVAREEAVYEAWAQTESNFQRRADLIPALVDTVSRYLRHESDTLTAVTRERGEGVKSLGSAVDELIRSQREAARAMAEHGRAAVEEQEALAEVFAAQTAVGQRVQGLLAVVESYPDLRSSDQFLELQAQIEGTENRINVARMRFNEAVRDYNAATRQLPGSLVAAVGNFRRKAYFEAEEEAAAGAPTLQFD